MDAQDSELVPVYSVNEPTQAQALKNALESEGIACEIEGGNQAALSGVLEIRLFVRDEDAPRARKFLEAHDS